MAADNWESPIEKKQREAEDKERQKSERRAPAGDEVDWVALWDEFNVDHDSKLSLTQLRLAVECSEHTGVHTRGAAEVLLAEATDAGLLEERRYLAAKMDNEKTIVKVGGWVLAPEVRER